MEAVITVIALLFLLFVVLGAYATVKVIGAAKRGVDRTISQARRTVGNYRKIEPAIAFRGADQRHISSRLGHRGGDVLNQRAAPERQVCLVRTHAGTLAAHQYEAGSRDSGVHQRP